MEKFEPTIEKHARESSLKTSQPETSGDGVRSLENGSEESAKTMNREEALRELREIALKDPVYDFDDKEDFRRILSLWKTVGGDPMIDLEVSKILSHIRDSSYEELGMNFLEEGKRSLKEIQLNTKSALVRLWIDSVLRVPFEGVDLERKREFLKESWGHVCAFVVSNEPHLFEKYFDKPNSVLDNADPRDIEYLFSAFREESFSWFRYEDGREMFDRFHEPELTEKYNLPLPNIPKWYTEEIPSEQGRIVSSVSAEYGVVYSTGFSVEYFFALDWNKEGAESEREKGFVKRLTAEDVLRAEGLSGSNGKDILNVHDLSRLYTTLIEPAFRKKIEDDFGIELKDFSVRVQVQFLNFLFEKNEEEVKRVIKFIGSKYRPHSFFLLEEDRKKKENYEKVDPENFFDPAVSKNRLKSFLSLEQGGADMGEKILTIGEKLPKEVADTVFGKYAEMADSIGSLESSLREYYDGEKKDEYVRSIGERILVRAKDMLIRFSDLEMDVDYLLKMLDRERASVAVFLATCKILRKEKKMPSLEELPSVNFRAMTSRELSLEPELVHEMRSIYEENYAAYPKEFREKIVGSLQERISKNSVFYLLKKDDQLLAFNAFTRNDDGTLSFGSFNILPEAQGNALAEAMIESTVLKHGEEWKLVAECDARKPISKKYIEYGFFVKRMYSAHFSDGDVPVLVIERNPHGLHSRKHEEVGEVKELAVPLVKLEETLTPLLAEGFVVTRYENQNLENILCSLERP